VQYFVEIYELQTELGVFETGVPLKILGHGVQALQLQDTATGWPVQDYISICTHNNYYYYHYYKYYYYNDNKKYYNYCYY